MAEGRLSTSCPRRSKATLAPYLRLMETGLVMTFDELAPVIDPWRISTVPSAARGGPVHVTVLYPWVEAPVATSDLDRLAVLLAGVGPITLTFDRLERFPSGVLYLALDAASEARCRAFTSLVWGVFPSCVPYSGDHPDPTPHITIATADDDATLDRIANEVRPLLTPLLPYVATIAELVVMTQAPDGRWHRAHQLPLMGGAGPNGESSTDRR